MAAVFDKLSDDEVEQCRQQKEENVNGLLYAEAVEYDASRENYKILVFYPRCRVRFPEIEKHSECKESYLPGFCVAESVEEPIPCKNASC